MTIPASYTEKTLAQYMHTSLGKVATALGLAVGVSDAGSYAEAVNDALLAYGTDDISTITTLANLKKLRALALVYAWRFVMNNFAALYDFSADGASYDRSQLFKQAKEALGIAEFQALPYDTGYQGKVVVVDHKQNPYKYRPEDENSL